MSQVSIDVQLMYWLYFGVTMKQPWNAEIFRRGMQLEKMIQEELNINSASAEEMIQFILNKLIEEKNNEPIR